MHEFTLASYDMHFPHSYPKWRPTKEDIVYPDQILLDFHPWRHFFHLTVHCGGAVILVHQRRKMASYYAIEDILSVAAIHPFYNSSTTYPPDQDAIASLRGQTARQLGKSWSSWPLLRKDEL